MTAGADAPRLSPHAVGPEARHVHHLRARRDLLALLSDRASHRDAVVTPVRWVVPVGIVVLALAWLFASEARAHFDHDSGQPQHYYVTGGWAKSADPEESCREWTSYYGGATYDSVAPKLAPPGATAAEWGCYWENSANSQIEVAQMKELHCDPDMEFASGGPCVDGYWTEVAFTGLDVYNYVAEASCAGGDCGLTDRSHVNMNLCSLSDVAVEAMQAYNRSGWNEVVKRCSETDEFLAVAALFYYGPPNGDSGACHRMQVSFLGGGEYDYVGTYNEKIEVGEVPTACNAGVYEFDCPAGETGDYFGTWEYPTDEANPPPMPTSWCYASCRHVPRPSSVEADNEGVCVAIGDDPNYHCSIEVDRNGETCLEGVEFGEDAGDPAGGGADGGGGGDPDNGGGDGGGGTGDSEGIIAAVDGLKGPLSDIDGKLAGIDGKLDGIGDELGGIGGIGEGIDGIGEGIDGIGESLDGIEDAITGPYTAAEEGTQDFSNPYAEWEAKRDEIGTRVAGLRDLVADPATLSLSSASYVCDAAGTVRGIEIDFCLTAQQRDQFAMVGTVVVWIASFSGIGIFLRAF